MENGSYLDPRMSADDKIVRKKFRLTELIDFGWIFEPILPTAPLKFIIGSRIFLKRNLTYLFEKKLSTANTLVESFFHFHVKYIYNITVQSQHNT